ncbi:MAG: plasmid pRiA4b ORF-3 family protein, partial [Chloroflexota bacterium]
HGENYAKPSPYTPGLLSEIGAKNGTRVKLSSLIDSEGEKFNYAYDFGDDWQHIVLVEKILTPDPDQKTPICIKGKRACPPEDVGGVWGYDTFIEAIKDSNHPDHEDYIDWIDGDFDPEAFDVGEVNQRLRHLQK